MKPRYRHYAARLAAACCLLACAHLVAAKEAEPLASDQVLEDRVNNVASELRCLVCQNQTIADSHADLAVDLKNQIREQLRQGETESQIKDYMVKRYGDFVLYRPPLNASTLFLWAGPFVLLALGSGVLFYTLKKRNRALADAAAAGPDLNPPS